MCHPVVNLTPCLHVLFMCLMPLYAIIWYSQRVRRSSHTLLKEKLMSATRICRWPKSTSLFSIGFNRLGLIEARCQTDDFVVSDRTQ